MSPLIAAIVLVVTVSVSVPAEEKPCREHPNLTGKTDLSDDVTVCPFIPARPGEMRLIRVDAATNASTAQPVRPPASACQGEAPKLLGKEAVRVSGQIRAPRKLRHVSPSYPKLPPGIVGSGSWVGELLIDAQGKVARVWTIREPRLNPPYPPFSKAIADAVRQWEFEPSKVKGVPTPVCMTVVTTVHWE